MKPVRLVTAALVSLALLAATGAFATGVGTAITYQGRVDRNNVAVNDTYSMIFKLYDAATGGTQIGTTQTVNGIVATNGLFSATIDFGAGVFTNQARWLDVQIKGSSDGSYTAMTARQPITAAPVALYALNGGTGSSQWVSDGNGNITYNGGAAGVIGQSTHTATGVGVFFDGGVTAGASVYGYNYGASQAIPLYLNAPGGNVLVGAVASPGSAKLDVLINGGPAVQATTRGSSFVAVNAAVRGVGNTGPVGDPTPSRGVQGESADDIGVYGTSTNYIGVYGNSTNADGTWGYSSAANKSGVVGISGSASGKGGYFRNDQGGVALYSDGLAKIKTLQILGGADLAERFETADHAEPGTVMAIDAASAGRVRVASGAYSRTVAGVVSGANGLDAGVELGKGEARQGTVALALTGRVWVRCDATHAAIHPGDLLTTADRAGYAMVAGDPARAPGAILGKAMTSLEHGTGLVLVLVSLQ